MAPAGVLISSLIYLRLAQFRSEFEGIHVDAQNVTAAPAEGSLGVPE